jgi:metal-responsive CopG/Arc/MetJ family transcriptional regulator
MARPKKEIKIEPITFGIDAEMLRQVEKQAAIWCKGNRSDFIRLAIQDKLDSNNRFGNLIPKP